VKTNVIEKGKWERELEVEVSAERIESELTRKFREYQQRLEVPGFRKGKVPLKIIKGRYGESIRQEVIADLLPTFLEEAASQAGLVPAAPPRISKLEHEPGRTLTFTAVLDIWPEVQIESYEGLEITRMIHEVTAEEIDEQLKGLQNRHATERSSDKPLAIGDVLIADLQRLDDSGLPLIGEKFEERRFVIGQDDAPSPEFESALVGIRAGEEREVRFTYRSDLPNAQRAGTPDHFMVKAREVRQRTLPEVDDEFAKDLGEQFQSLDDLRQHLSRNLGQRWEYLSQQRLRGELVEQLIRKNPFELPGSIVENFLESMHREQDRDRRSAPDPDHDHSEEERRAAERQLRRYLLLQGVRQRAAIAVSDEEFEPFLAQRAREIGVEPEALKRSPQVRELRRELEDEKTFALLLERAKIQEEKV
jgi:trigger factor